jgi:hypothetical protein
MFLRRALWRNARNQWRLGLALGQLRSIGLSGLRLSAKLRSDEKQSANGGSKDFEAVQL